LTTRLRARQKLFNAMGHVRPFIETDIPSVARLHRTVFNTASRADGASPDAYHAYFSDVFLSNPAQDPRLTSLVYEKDDGSIAGFLGVVPRRVTMNRRQFQAALSSQFIVDPQSRAAMIGVRLAKAFLEGPQDLSISDEASDTSRTIWEGLGGTTALLHSLHWTRPLQPARFALALLRGRPRLAILAVAAGPLAPLIDRIATRLPHSHLYQTKPDVSAVADLTEQTVLAYLPAFVRSGSLRVEYDEATLRWVLERAQRRRADDTFRAAVIRNDQRIIGWYLFHVDASRIANVLQIVADPAAISDVLDHLFYQAAEQGAVSVTGRLEPRFLQALSDKYCILHRRGPWVLLNARHQELLRSFESGEAMFSRLDGEWCLGF
jgi:predicted N-acetyltransferase YhbS